MSIDEVCPTCTRIALRLANEVNAAEKEIERLKAENASLLESLRAAEKERDEANEIATALGKQCAELERDRDYNAELLAAAEKESDETRAAGAEYIRQTDPILDKLEPPSDRASAAEKRAADLMGALKHARRLFHLYGQHYQGCPKSKGGPGQCTCAYDEADAALHDEERSAPPQTEEDNG